MESVGNMRLQLDKSHQFSDNHEKWQKNVLNSTHKAYMKDKSFDE